MWVIEGPFDGVESGVLPEFKPKLLKPGHTYPIGRKSKHPLQLIINHPKVSHEHVAFAVGDHSVDDTSTPSKIPTLKIFNHRPKMIQFERNRTRVIVNPSMEVELQHGDYIALVSGVYVRILWRPVCCLVPAKLPSIPFHKCAAIGIKIVASVLPEVTHHLVTMLSATSAVVGTTLIPAQLVKPDWLTELLRLGDEPYDIPQSQAVEPDLAQSRSALEYELTLPSETKYRPPFSPTLPPELKTLKTWEPNPERQNLFNGWRFVFIGRELDTDTRAVVERGGGEYEAFDVSGGPIRLQQTLERNRRKAEKGISVIGDAETLKVAAAVSWSSLEDVLRESSLRLIKLSALLEAVLYIDISRLESNKGVESQPSSVTPQESIIDNNVQEEGSSRRRPLRRRVTPASRATSTPPEPVVPVPVVEPVVSTPVEQESRQSVEPEVGRRKPLVRRVKASRAILGVDDPSFSDILPPDTLSSVDAAPPSSSIATPEIVDLFPPTPAIGRPSRLKRRTRDDAPLNPILAGLEKELAEADLPQPPLKKFKALFDETDPDRISSQNPSAGGLMYSGGIIEESQPYSQRRTETAQDVPSSLGAVPEEEEESESAAGPAPPKPAGADIDMLDIPESQVGASSKPVSKSSKSIKPLSSTQAQQSSLPPEKIQGKSSTGAAPGKPDTDAAFLKALASTKRGKKHEDAFDREFNNLRISKPDLDHEQQAEDYAVLADFGDESNVRGNFMVILEMDVPEHRSNSRAQSSEAERPSWRGKPDFKAFKKKNSHQSQPKVELVVDDENDYGMGSVYWKDGSQSQSQSQGEPSLGFLQPSQSQNRGFLQPPSQAPAPKSAGSSSRGIRSQSVVRSTRAASQEPARRGRSQSRGVKAESEVSDFEGMGSSNKGKGRASQRSQANGKGKKEQPLFLDTLDEEENETAATLDGLGPEELEEINLDIDADEYNEDEDEERGQTRRARARRAPSRAQSTASPAKGRKRAAAVLDDDSDSGMTFRGFSGKKARAK